MKILLRACAKILPKIMIFQKLAKTDFGQCLVFFPKKYFEILGKTYYYGNDITNTIPP